MTLILNSPQVMASPKPGTPKLTIPGDVFMLTSDTFSGADEPALTARTTDAGRGGSPIPYTFSNPAGYGIASGKLVRGTGTGNGAALLDLSAARSKDVTVTCTIPALPSRYAPGAYLIVRRDAVSSPKSQLRLGFQVNSMKLNMTINGASTTPAESEVPVVVGDRVGLREYDGLVEISLNGTVVKTLRYPAGSFTGNFAGFASLGPDTGPFGFDDFTVSETIR